MSVLVLHSTEGSTFAGARRTLFANNSMSHWLGDPATGEFEELVDPSGPARSLRNLSGGVETNNRGSVYQLEIVGFAATIGRTGTEGYPDQWYRQLGEWVKTICNRHGILRRFPYPFVGQSGYGRNGVARLTNRQWQEVAGIVGHQHVPENTHWDPGNIRQLIPHVEGNTTVPDRSSFIEQWQRALVANGADLGDSGPNGDGIDGDFGRLTLAGSVEILDGRNADIRQLTADLEECQQDVADREADIDGLADVGRRFVGLWEEAQRLTGQ